ncbi:hypothetical protein EDC96DRAFT_546843 [Choanephora cucurbitarum]|nr:hypothetical protein EDC96DRAFT_546843 [Choanephora cucurbitarum]
MSIHLKMLPTLASIWTQDHLKRPTKAKPSTSTEPAVPESEGKTNSLWLYRKKGLYKRLAINESSFNHLLVWPMMELAVDEIDDEELTFVTAEYVLKSSVEEYKTDGCILFGGDELCLL